MRVTSAWCQRVVNTLLAPQTCKQINIPQPANVAARSPGENASSRSTSDTQRGRERVDRLIERRGDRQSERARAQERARENVIAVN